MECGEQDIALPYGNDVSIELCEDLNVFRNRAYLRRPDEYHRELPIRYDRGALSYTAIDLGAIGIPLHLYINALPYTSLGKKDDTCAGTPDRQALTDQLLNRLFESRRCDEPPHGRTFSTRKNEAVNTIKLCRPPDEPAVYAMPFEV